MNAPIHTKLSSSHREPFHCESLIDPPREISIELKKQVLQQQFNTAQGLATLLSIAFVTSGIYFAIGAIGMSNPPAFSRIGGVIAIFAGMTIYQSTAKRRKENAERIVTILRYGKCMKASLTEIYDRGKGSYLKYEEAVKELQSFQSNGAVIPGYKKMLRNWPVKLAVQDANGSKSIETRIDLGEWISNPNRESFLSILTPKTGNVSESIILENEPWLAVDEHGQFCNRAVKISQSDQEQGLASSVFNAMLVVVPTYLLAAYGILSTSNSELANAANTIPPIVGAFVTVLFTLTHGVVPVFFYRLFVGGIEAVKSTSGKSNPGMLIATGFTILHMTIWYGGPILGLASMTNWYSIGWVALHVIFAGKHRRQWAYLEHGSTSMALFLFLVMFSKDNLYPIGIVVVIFQSLLLTIVEWKGKRLWIKSDKAEK